MRACLYHEDYGPTDPQFDVHANHDALLHGVEGWHRLLGQARNRDEFDAAKGVVLSGKNVAWCDQGYEWTETPTVEWGIFLLLVVLLPWRLFRLWHRLAP
jgi:hypothetical protein